MRSPLPCHDLPGEPSAERGRAVMEMLRRVAHEQGTAVVVVTHDHRSLDVFDATYAMEDGRLSEATRPA